MNWGDLIVDIEPAGGVSLLDFLKTYTGIVDDDTGLATALNISGPVIEGYLDRVIAKRVATEYFPHHFGTVILHEPQVDRSEPVVVTLDGVVQSGYEVFIMRGKVAHLTRTGTRMDYPMDWRTYEQVVVTYTAGFDPIPIDLANAIIYTAALVHQSNGTSSIPSESGDVKSMSIYDVGSISYDVSGSAGGSGDGMFGSTGIVPDTAAQMLTRYKRMVA